MFDKLAKIFGLFSPVVICEICLSDYECLLPNLNELYLGDNQIAILPEWFQSLKYLEKIDLRNNPLSILPEIFGSENLDEDPHLDAKIILDFYFNSLTPTHPIDDIPTAFIW
jgi:Leucine-rich repeat (LRR) protein